MRQGGRHEQGLPTLMSIKKVIYETGLSRNTVKKALKTPELPSKKYGRRRLIRREDFEHWTSPPTAPNAQPMSVFTLESVRRPEAPVHLANRVYEGIEPDSADVADVSNSDITY